MTRWPFADGAHMMNFEHRFVWHSAHSKGRFQFSSKFIMWALTWLEKKGKRKSNTSQTQAKPKRSQAKAKPSQSKIWLVKSSFYQSKFIYSRFNKILKLHYVIKNATPSQVLLPHWFCFPKKSSDGIRLHYQLLHYFSFHWILLETYHHRRI